VQRHDGDPGAFHERVPAAGSDRLLWLLRPDRPALVLGSAQRDDAVDRDLARRWGVDVVRRRSGGSAVLLEPGAVVWADLVIARHDPLWHDDIGRATWWVGRLWQQALAALGIDAAVHRGPMRHGPHSDRICFAGLGPGEVVVDGRKVVGISQRRTREFARFQTAVLLRWDPDRLAVLCGLDPAGPDGPALRDVAAGIGADLDEVEAALVAALPT
jgi:lipoate-protein ligase A